MHRVDLFPTHEYQGLKLRPGRPYPFGATVIGNMVNFSVYSRYATDCTPVLFHNRDSIRRFLKSDPEVLVGPRSIIVLVGRQPRKNVSNKE